MARLKPSQTAKPFDATTKTLVETHPVDWLTLLNMPTDAPEVIDADLAALPRMPTD